MKIILTILLFMTATMLMSCKEEVCAQCVDISGQETGKFCDKESEVEHWIDQMEANNPYLRCEKK